jgi:hypothetical protein
LKPKSLQEAIETISEEEMDYPITKEEIEKGKTVFRASGISYLCQREEVLCSVDNVTRIETTPVRMRLIMDTGTWVHRQLQSYFADKGILYGHWRCIDCGKWYGEKAPKGVDIREAPIHPELFVQKPQNCECGSRNIDYIEPEFINREFLVIGHADGLIGFGSDGPTELLEIKTINEDGFMKVANGKPLPAHVVQVNIYMWLTGLRRTRLLYYEKNKSYTSEILIDYDPKKIEVYQALLKQIIDGVKSGNAPLAGACSDPNDSRARKCAVRKKCFETWDDTTGTWTAPKNEEAPK